MNDRPGRPKLERTTAESSGASSRRASVALFVAAAAVCGLAAALASADAEGPWRLAAGALALVVGGAALGTLALITPVEPSPLKLTAFAGALGLPLGGAVVLAARGALGGGGPAAALALALGALTALLACSRRLHLAPPGRAAWCAIALAFAAGAAVWLGLTSGAGLSLRAATPGAVAHATLASEWLGEGAAPRQPWLAGGAATVRVGPSLAVAFAAGATGLGVLRACAAVCALAAALLVAGTYLGAAAVARGAPARWAGARDLLAALAALAAATSCVGPEALPDPAAAGALLLGGAACLASLHAARSGATPWPALAILCVAAASMAAPAAAVAAAAVGATLASRERRLALAVLLLVACAPGVLEARAVGAAGVLPGAPIGGADLRLALGVVLLGAVPAAFAACHAAVPPRWFLAGAVAATAALVGAAAPGLRARALEFSELSPALEEVGGRLEVAGGNQRLRALRDAFAAIRAADLAQDAPGAALLRWSAGAEPGPHAPPSLTPLLTGLPLWWDRAPPPGAGEEAITAAGERRSERGEVARALFEDRGGWRARHGRVLMGSAARRGALVAVVTDADRRRTALRAGAQDAPDLALRSLGARVLHEADGVTVYVLRPR